MSPADQVHEHGEAPGREHGDGHAHGHAHDDGHAHEHDNGDEHGHAHGDERENTKSPSKSHKHGGHDHAHDHADLRKTPLNRLAWAFGITAAFMVVEAGVGWWSKSLALVADAGHMLTDAAALGLAMIAQRMATQNRTRAQTYGFRRAEVLAAFANGVVLALTAIWVFIEAADRWRNPPSINGAAVTVTAVTGLIVNMVAAAMLGAGSGGQNINTRAALAHVLTDAVGSVGAIVSGVLVLVYSWARADAVISTLIGILVLWGGYRLVRDTSRVLMEGSPIEIDIAHVEETILKVPGVVAFHDLHVWSISEGFDVLTVHVVIGKGFHGTDVVAAVSRALRERHGLDHCTIQPEPSHDDRLVTLRRRPEASASPKTQ